MSDEIYIDITPVREVTYTVTIPEGGWRRSFDMEYAGKLQPIAETLAMLDGNAFRYSWQNYLPEADALYRNNGGDNGWAGICSWIEHDEMMAKDPTLKELWNKLKTLLALKANND